MLISKKGSTQPFTKYTASDAIIVDKNRNILFKINNG